MKEQPLCEVFGFPINNESTTAKRLRKNRLCPFGNKVPNCTKDKANNPLGVCSVFDGSDVAITCPIRFREGWIIAEDAASFFFEPDTLWSTLTEVRLNDADDKSAGNIDVVLVAYNSEGKVIDFGALEIQAVYISGNIRNPFELFMKKPNQYHEVDWNKQRNYPRPDYLSSSRKRLAPQLMFKGGILKAWNKKIAVAIGKSFFKTLPSLKTVDRSSADIAWFVYDLVLDSEGSRNSLVLHDTIYTKFNECIDRITKSRAGDVGDFVKLLQCKMDEILSTETPTDNETIDAIC